MDNSWEVAIVVDAAVENAIDSETQAAVVVGMARLRKESILLVIYAP